MKTLFTEGERRALRESSLSVEDALRAVHETALANQAHGYAFTRGIAERAGVSMAALKVSGHLGE